MQIPRPIRRAVRTRRRSVQRWARIRRGRALSRVRVSAWTGDLRWSRVVPRGARARLRLEPPPPGERRIEIGAGFSGRPGYVHVDLLPFTDDIDVLASGDELPFPAQWADEILTVHMIEHVRPPRLRATLQHWYDRLRPGGELIIHTPNGTALGKAMAAAGDGKADDEHYWAVMSAVFGYGHHPADMTSPESLTGGADHKLVFTSPLLCRLLGDAGFVDVEDVSGDDAFCHHTRDWSPYVDGLCLEVRARRPDS